MNNDLISRNALIQHAYSAVVDGVEKDIIDLSDVDNAPTVFSCNACKNMGNERECVDCHDYSNYVHYDEKPQGEWIPAIERLPEDMQRVLIWFEYYRYGDFNCMFQTYGFGYVCDGKWSPFINGETGWQDYRVIAWQPLPEPYKKGGAE